MIEEKENKIPETQGDPPIEIKEEVKSKPEVTKLSEEGKLAKLDNFTNVKEMIDFAEVLLRSGLVPSTLRKPEQVVAVIQQGRELGIGAVTSLNNIHNIQGKATLSVHVIGALLKKAGIKYQLLKDYEDHIIYSTKEGEENKEIGRTKITTIRFFEKFGNKIIENDVSYTWGEATKAGLTFKDNWVKMPKIMMRARALAIGGRFVAPDALLGMYETSEWAEVKGEVLNLDEEGNIISK